MKALQLIDWDLLQLQYEILHEPLDQIAEANDVSTTTLQYAIEEKGWERKEVPMVMDNASGDLDDAADALKKRIKVVQLLKIANFNARYTQLESKAITRLKDLVEDLDTGLPHAAAQMKDIISAMKELKSLSESSGGESINEEDGSGSSLHVNILNQVESVAEETPKVGDTQPKVCGSTPLAQISGGKAHVN